MKYYMRYMDDIIILMDSKEKLHELRKRIETYFETRMRITLKDNWQVFPTFKRGIDYLGYRSFLDFTLLRKTTCQSFKKKMLGIRKKVESGIPLNQNDFCCAFSYSGWLIACNSYRLKMKYLEPLKEALQEYFTRMNMERVILSG